MRIIAKSKIVDYYTENPEAEIALEDWYHKSKHYVFNIKGNNYRLIVVIKFTIKTILIRFIGTHADYDKIDVKNI